MAFSEKYTYKINKINDDQSVELLVDCDGSTQRVATLDLSSTDALQASADAYVQAYVDGKKLEDANTPVAPSKDLQALVGKKMDATPTEE